MTEARLPAHMEAGGLIRAAQAAGGFGTVLAKGEREAGTLLVVCCHQRTPARAYERMPQPGGTRQWTLAKVQDAQNPSDFTEYCDRRRQQDPDLWIVELEVAGAEALLGLDPYAG